MSIFSKSINQWCYGRINPALPKTIKIGDVDCCYTNELSVTKGECNGVKVFILGLCVDAMGKWNQAEIAQELAELSFDPFSEATDNLCGVYVIFRVESNGEVRVLSDATHMMPVYYCISGRNRGVVASCEALIVDHGEEISQVSQNVLRGANDKGHYLVADMTMYDSVKCLLANHYLDVSSMAPVRYFPRKTLKKASSEREVDEIIAKTFEMTRRVVAQFSRQMRFASPLTPGADSRVSCAFLKACSDADVSYYVIRNNELTNRREIEPFLNDLARKMGIEDFRVFPEEKYIDEAELRQVREECGDIRSWSEIVWAYHPFVKGRAVVRGDIIDHLAKSGFRRQGESEILARVGYLKALQRNTSKEGRREFGKWYREMAAGAKGYSYFDLWHWEMRCGRWNSNTASISNILGIQDVNIFNCTKMLAEWCRLDPKLRSKAIVHRKFIEWLSPSVSAIPINPYRDLNHEHIPDWLARMLPGWVLFLGKYWMNLRRNGC